MALPKQGNAAVRWPARRGKAMLPVEERRVRRILGALGGISIAIVAALAAVLGEAHWEIRGLDPPLPEREELLTLLGVDGGPVRVRYLDTASQPGPGPATIGHPVFVVEWSDGRSFLIDAGMDRESALEFGVLAETAFGSEPIVPHGSVTEQLGDAVARVAGIAFTHLHSDHTNGLLGLCDALARPLPVFQTPGQASRSNYTTTPGRADLDAASCARIEVLADGPLYAVPGLPGLAAIEAAGHTPGSTIYAAAIADRVWLFAGDVTNFMENLQLNRAKPRIYSLVVPENRTRLERLRIWLRDLDAEDAFVVRVSHDLDALEASPMRAWTASP